MSTTYGFLLGAEAAMASPATETHTATQAPAAENGSAEEQSYGLIADLGWILVLGAISTLIFKRLKQPVVLGYIIAGFLASPNFTYLPSISNLANIEVWAQVGIVVLMFTLGLEFSFKKLMNSGSSAVVTALIIITGMTFAGFGVGRLLHMNTINCIFLGGMISMSSTTIILKALTDLGLRQKKFASMVLAVLIIEDLFAVLMLVLLSSIAVGEVRGGDLLLAVTKLCFFLVLWFVVGVYVLPTFLQRQRSFLNSETMLILSMGLCFGMAVLSVQCGFSLELGAFVMGSVLAGTMAAERIEKVVHPIKDLFGSVFFISVGMMVDPGVIAQYWSQILLLAAVVIVGMIVFGSLGMLATGQTLRVAIESGFTLTQVGEFSFIIAALGMTLGVLEPTLYPIIVAVSVITIFTTPYFIKMSGGFYGFLEKHLPHALHFLLERYQEENKYDESKERVRGLIMANVKRIVLYTAVIVAVIMLSLNFVFPLSIDYLGKSAGKLVATAGTLVIASPLVMALAFSNPYPRHRKKGEGKEERFYEVPVLAMRIIRVIIALLCVVYFVSMAYTSTLGWIVGVICFGLMALVAGRRLMRQYDRIEKKFIDNLNIRENTRSGANNNIVDDLHMAFIEIGQSCAFAGSRLRDSGLRRRYGVSISSIQRGLQMMPLPSSDTRVLPGDILGVIGTDDQIKHLNDDLEQSRLAAERSNEQPPEVKLKAVRLLAGSPIVNVPLGETDIRGDYYSMLLKVRRGEEYLQPGPDTVLRAGDVIWVVGDPTRFDAMKGTENTNNQQ